MSQLQQNGNIWALQGDVTLQEVMSVLKQAEALQMPAQLVVDFAGVTDVDTSAISLMLEWMRQAQRENKQVAFEHVSADLLSLAQLYGVQDMLPIH